MRSALAGAGILMVALGITGIVIALTAGGQLGDARTAYGAGLTALVIASVMVIGVGALMVNLTVLRHQRSIEKNLIARLAEHDRQRVAAEQLMRDTLNDVVQELRARRDEIATDVDRRLDEIEDQHNRLEELMNTVFQAQQREATVIGDVLNGKLRALPRGS